ncbi:MAG: hypothetical protein HXO98_00530 [Streptococcus sp.]|jgi:hypothetical protein|nr:hypothetical protein [Streptococcus sp.]
MKKVIAIIILFFVGAMAVTCSKPTITKEQQNNVAIRIYKNYDIQEIEFVRFTKNESTGSYTLKLRINNDENLETTISIMNITFLDKKDGEMSLNPVGKFDDLQRKEVIKEDVPLSKIKIKYIGEK